MSILKGLNAQQKKAVVAPDGPVLVLAGPGSGKTRVLTRRVAWLVLEQEVYPWRILAVTFTNKAAREMRERLEQLLGHSQAGDLTLGTFHATCARILRQEAEAAGISRDYTIFDADDQVALTRQVILELNLDEKRYRPHAVHNAISRAKNELIPPEEYQPGSYFGEIVRRVYEQYQQRLRLSGALDFDDLLMVTVNLFRQQDNVTRRYQERYRYILVDEFQDTNAAQYVLLQQLAGRHHNLFAVADEDQSIYAWRGADYRNINRLRQDHPDLTTYLLEQNYRSTQHILDTAQAIIRHNADRTEKRLFTRRGQGDKTIVHEAYDPGAEAQFIVDTIAELVATKEARPGDFAVMYRTNAQSRAIEDAFIHAGLPYRLVGATRFYARREIKDLVAFLRTAHNPSDSASLLRIINVPPRRIGRKTVASLEKTAREQNVSPWQIVAAVVGAGEAIPALSKQGRGAVAAFHKMVAGWIEARGELSVHQLIDRVLADTGYEAYLRDGSDEGEERWENVLELRGVALEYAGMTLTEFLADVALVSDVDNMGDEVDAPTLLTLHSAKGLEFPIVFLTGVEEGLIPHSRSIDEPEGVAEERRLMYVGVTRAQDRLYITHTFRRPRYGDYETNVPSRFLDDIPRRLLQDGRSRARQRAPETTPAWERWEPAPAAPAARFHTGDRVVHPVFGPGIVLESRGGGEKEQVTVIFENVGLKRILGDFLERST
ncbi:MAG: UvrD-helicase domain-containing protein [Anaerolineae bacterium]|nr:UvrD-helicase domain-containing protein [Anaerolineae bacterium]